MNKRMMTTLALSSGLLLASAGLVACSSGEDAGSSSGGAAATGESDRARAHRMVEEGATLLDVRTPGEFSGGHVEGAVNIPLSELDSRMSEVPADQPVVVYCLSGGRSSRAASQLEARGYEVFDLGAMRNW